MRFVHYSGLEDFGFRFPRELTRLGLAKIRIQVSLWYPPTRTELRVPPPRRLKVRNASIRRIADRLCSRHALVREKRRSSDEGPHLLEGSVPAKDLARLARERSVDRIKILGVPGRRAKKVKWVRGPSWYAVRALFAIQVEGELRGMQTYEDRIVLTRARSFDEAVHKLRKGFKEYGTPHLTSHGRMARWQFEKVIDVFETFVEKLEDGAEVWSSLHERRLKPAKAWLPKW